MVAHYLHHFGIFWANTECLTRSQHSTNSATGYSGGVTVTPPRHMPCLSLRAQVPHRVDGSIYSPGVSLAEHATRSAGLALQVRFAINTACWSPVVDSCGRRRVHSRLWRCELHREPRDVNRCGPEVVGSVRDKFVFKEWTESTKPWAHHSVCWCTARHYTCLVCGTVSVCCGLLTGCGLWEVARDGDWCPQHEKEFQIQEWSWQAMKCCSEESRNCFA